MSASWTKNIRRACIGIGVAIALASSSLFAGNIAQAAPPPEPGEPFAAALPAKVTFTNRGKPWLRTNARANCSQVRRGDFYGTTNTTIVPPPGYHPRVSHLFHHGPTRPVTCGVR